MKKSKAKTFKSVWDALADSPEEAVNLCLRSALMQQIAVVVEKSGWTQAASRASHSMRW
jgi:predicted XRE-type DNA-binding protein